jgi:hypothetical protein
MAKYLSDIVTYFKELCENHPTLLHSDDSGSRVFEVSAYEDAFSDFRTAGQEKSFFVRLILPTMTMGGKGNNAQKKYQAGLMVGCYYSRREDPQTEMVESWSAAEQVADDFMARMIYDSRHGHDLFTNSVSTAEALDVNGEYLPTQGDGSFAAVLYTFNFGVFRCLDADGADFAAWTDL